MDKWYLITQIDRQGEETGIKKLIQGAREAAIFMIGKNGNVNRRGVENNLSRMEVDSFKTFFIAPFNYEVDCLSGEDAKSIDVDDADVIKYKEVPVYEVFCSDNSKFYAFGDADLIEKLTAPEMFSTEDVENIMDDLYDSGKAELVREKPEYFTAAVDKLSAELIDKLASDDAKFALELETAKKMLVESSEPKDGAFIEECEEGFKLSIFKEGKEIRNFWPVESKEEAEKLQNFLEESGALGDDEVRVVRITFSSLRVVDKAIEAISDSPFLMHNTSWISAHVLAFSGDDEDDAKDMIDEVKAQLEAFGIEEDDYEIDVRKRL